MLVVNYNAQLKLTKVTARVTWQGINARRDNVTLVTVVSKRAKHVGG